MVNEKTGMFLCNFKMDGCLDWIFVYFRKNVCFSHPADVVLSVIDKMQSPGWRHFDVISIQGVMMEAMNLRRLLNAQKQYCS